MMFLHATSRTACVHIGRTSCVFPQHLQTFVVATHLCRSWSHLCVPMIGSVMCDDSVLKCGHHTIAKATRNSLGCEWVHLVPNGNCDDGIAKLSCERNSSTWSMRWSYSSHNPRCVITCPSTYHYTKHTTIMVFNDKQLEEDKVPTTHPRATFRAFCYETFVQSSTDHCTQLCVRLLCSNQLFWLMK